jgi:type II secretory pathway pseudopilin PulG
MKNSILALLILVILATFAMPVITAKEDDGVQAGITVAAATTRTTSSGEQEKRQGADDTVTVTPTTRETIEVEHGTETEADDSSHKSGRSIAEVREKRHKSLENLNAPFKISVPGNVNVLKTRMKSGSLSLPCSMLKT